jgi:hypothetical protein
MRNDYGNKPRKKLAGGKRVGKQFGGGLPIQPPVAASPMGVAAPAVSPMGVAAPGRRFGVKHGGRSKK